MISKSEDFYAPLLLERWIQTEASGGICSGVLRVSPIFQHQGRFKTPSKDKFEFLDACHPLSGHVASSTETEDGEVQSGLFLSFNSGLETQIETLPPQIKSKVRVKLKLTRLQYLVLALF